MQNANALPHRNPLRPALLWAGLCLILLVVLLSLLPGARLNSSVLAMLPKQTLGAVPPALNDGFMQRLDRQLVWLVSPGKRPDPRVAQQWLTLLQRSQALSEVKGPLDAAGQRAWGIFLAAPQWTDRSGHPRPPAKRRRGAGPVDPVAALLRLFRRERQGAAKRSADADARRAARAGEEQPEDAADGRLAGDER